MTNIERLFKYYELVKELQGVNTVYSDVTIELLDDTTIKETWSNPKSEVFHTTEFQLKDLEHINKKLYDKKRYIEQKNAKAHENIS